MSPTDCKQTFGVLTYGLSEREKKISRTKKIPVSYSKNVRYTNGYTIASIGSPYFARCSITGRTEYCKAILWPFRYVTNNVVNVRSRDFHMNVLQTKDSLK